jgi:hypothetical protein
MDRPEIEPRNTLWAIAEVSWEDPVGTPRREPATLEDTSASGACLRVSHPFGIGARLTVKWQREQFSAIARNCRKDGTHFLLGVKRGPAAPSVSAPMILRPDAPKPPAGQPESKSAPPRAIKPETPAGILGAIALQRESRVRKELAPYTFRLDHPESEPVPVAKFVEPIVSRSAVEIEQKKPSSSPERKSMQPTTFFSQFWRRRQNGDAPAKSASMEASVTTRNSSASENEDDVRRDLLSYEDIYHAAGIMSSRSGYGIHKVIEMLQSERIRDLSKEVKRASVLMALDVAGTGVGELLEDATRRQDALTAYESAQRKHLDEFEARMTRENAQLDVEIERLRAHYTERAQQNRDQVAREREALRNWQMAVQHESQRIADVMELCGKPAPVKSAVAPSGSSPDLNGDEAHGKSRAASAS